MTREKKLRQAARESEQRRQAEHAFHQETAALLDAMRQASHYAKGRIVWLESCIDEYRRCKQIGLIKDCF